MPHPPKVSDAPDVTALALLVVPGMERSDPAGMIACPAPCNVRYAAYSFCSRDPAASQEEQGDSFSFVLEHEFENQILAALGYSLRWR